MSIRTFANLYNEVLAWMDESGATGTTLTIIKNALNNAHAQRCQQEEWPFMLWPELETLTLTVDDRIYALHQEFDRPLYFWNRGTKQYLIDTPIRQIGPSRADWTNDTGRASRFWLSSRSQVEYQPTSASVITIVSSSTGDTTAAKAITIRGMTSNGITTESLTPSGTTSVAGTTSFTKILQVTKGASWTGTMTMTSNSGAVTLLKLLPTELGRDYQTLELLLKPDTADVIEYRFYRKPYLLANDNDLPDLPPPHCRILVYDALLHLAGYNTDVSPSALAMWAKEQDKWERALGQDFLDGQSLQAEPRYVRVFDQDQETAVPFVWRS